MAAGVPNPRRRSPSRAPGPDREAPGTRREAESAVPRHRRRRTAGALGEAMLTRDQTSPPLLRERDDPGASGPPGVDAHIHCDNGPELAAIALRDRCRFSGAASVPRGSCARYRGGPAGAMALARTGRDDVGNLDQHWAGQARPSGATRATQPL